MEEKSKQNITRDIEVKNNPTIARGDRGGDSGEKGFQELIQGYMDKTKGEGGSRGGRWAWLGWGRGVRRKCRQL